MMNTAPFLIFQFFHTGYQIPKFYCIHGREQQSSVNIEQIETNKFSGMMAFN